MIPQMDIQGAGTAPAQVSAANDPSGKPGADPEAANDFRKVLGTGTMGRHGPVSGGKPGTRAGSKTAAADEMTPEGPGLGVAVPIPAVTPRAAPTAPPTETGSLPTPAAWSNSASADGKAAGADGSALAAAQSVAGAQIVAGAVAAQADLPAAGQLHVQTTGSAISPSGAIGLVPQGPPMPLDLAGFAAQHGTFAAKTVASSSGDLRYSEPDNGAATQSPGQNPAIKDAADQNVAQDLAASPGTAEPRVDAPSIEANAAQQTSQEKDVSLRSAFSQAAAILIWQAGIGAETSGALEPTSSLLPKSKPPASAPIAATATPGPIPLTDPVLQAQLQNPQPVGDAVPSQSVPLHSVPSQSAAEKPSGAAHPDGALLPLDPGAPTPSAPLDAALNKPIAITTTLPAPFHPFVASIRLHASAHGRLGPGPAGAELLLHPADLGRIRFALSGTGDQLTITIAAENPDTLRLLQRHVSDLREELAHEGLGQAALSFAGPGSDSSGGQGARDQPLAAPPTAEQTDLAAPDLAPEAPLPPPAIAPQSGGGLDLRL